MGILNVTPDSCYDGGKYFHIENALARAKQIEQEGGDWIDIGGESTRPNAEYVHPQEELRRVLPVIREIRGISSLPISIDTYKPEVAKAAIDAGATLINDITALTHPDMIAIAKDTQVMVCLTHMQGVPQTMQNNPEYPRGCVNEIIEWFEQKIDFLLGKGLLSSQLILDPGIGFGKTVAHNFEIIHNLSRFKTMGLPLLLGHSRKSFLMHHLQKPREELLPSTLAIASFALMQGVDGLRVHDVGPHKDVINTINRC